MVNLIKKNKMVVFTFPLFSAGLNKIQIHLEDYNVKYHSKI